MTRSVSSASTAAKADVERIAPADGLGAAERQRAQRLLLVLARLGAAVSEALHARVDHQFASNVEVLVLTSLDLLGPQRPGDLITLTGLTSGGVTKVIDRLEEQKLIARRYGSVKGDRRGTRLVLTPEGASVAAELAEGLASQMEAVRDAIRELESVTRS